MTANSSVPENNPDSITAMICDDASDPSAIKYSCSNSCINTEKYWWSAKCNSCFTCTADTYKTTSNFIEHLKNRHQSMYEDSKSNQG